MTIGTATAKKAEPHYKRMRIRSANVTFDRVGTLCDDPVGLTCSIDAAKKWGRSKNILPFPSFELAAEAVKKGETSGMLIPAAYPFLNCFIYDEALDVQEVFLHRIPSIVLVGKNNIIPSAVEVLYHHPATEPLLEEIPVHFDSNIHVSSNTQACYKLLDSKENCIAITNELCATHFKLVTYRILRTGILMPFIIFTKTP